MSLPSLPQGGVCHWSVSGWLPHFQTPSKCCKCSVLCLEFYFSFTSLSLCCHLNKTSQKLCVLPLIFIRVNAGKRRMRGVDWLKGVERYMAQTAAVSYPTSPDWYHTCSHLWTKLFRNVLRCQSSFTIPDSLLKAVLIFKKSLSFLH